MGEYASARGSHRPVTRRCDPVDGAIVYRRAAHDHRKDEWWARMLNIPNPDRTLVG